MTAGWLTAVTTVSTDVGSLNCDGVAVETHLIDSRFQTRNYLLFPLKAYLRKNLRSFTIDNHQVENLTIDNYLKIDDYAVVHDPVDDRASWRGRSLPCARYVIV